MTGLVTYQGRVMACELHIVLLGGTRGAAGSAAGRLAHLEARWSRFLAGSDISRLNRATGEEVVVDSSTLALLATMIEAWRVTAGGYDPTVLPELVALGYDASREDPSRRCELTERCRALPVAARHERLAAVQLDPRGRTVRLPEGLTLDPGGIGKGLAADLVTRELVGHGVAGALISIGGDIATAGTPPVGGWPVAVECPAPADGVLPAFTVSGGGVATSSTCSRRWRRHGTERHHLVDPRTGQPSATDLLAATVVASTGWLAEAHATAALGRGSDGFVPYLQGHGLSGLAFTDRGGIEATDDLTPVTARSAA